MRKKALIILGICLCALMVMRFWGSVQISNSQAEAFQVIPEPSPSPVKINKKSPKPFGSSEKSHGNLEKAATATPEARYPVLTAADVYCRLLEAGVDLSQKHNLKFSFVFNPVAVADIFSLRVWLSSDECAPGTFSVVQLDGAGQVMESTDCTDKKPEDAFMAGLQGNIVSTFGAEEDFNLHLAISGEGLFVVQCEGETLYVRRGKFVLNSDGTVTNENGCLVLNKEGQPLNAEPHMIWDEQGCTTNGDCVAVATPRQGTFAIQNRDTLLALGEPMQELMDRPYIMDHALEDTEDPEIGLLGPDFTRLPTVEKPRSCAGHQ